MIPGRSDPLCPALQDVSAHVLSVPSGSSWVAGSTPPVSVPPWSSSRRSPLPGAVLQGSWALTFGVTDNRESCVSPQGKGIGGLSRDLDSP